MALQLGSAVRELEYRPGGFSWGVLGVATLESGERVFIKAVYGDAAGYREEAVVAAALPASVPTPRLRFAVERAGWVLLCFDEAPGALPHEPWWPGELEAALAALTTCARALTPSPVRGVPTLAERMAGWPGSRERDHPEWLAGDTLLHFDPRFDNFVIDGMAMLVDWGRACTGPAWVDLVCLLLESDLGGRDPQQIFAGHPLGRAADPVQVDAFLVALASYWTHTSALPGPPHAPHLQARREYSRRATLAWLQARVTNSP